MSYIDINELFKIENLMILIPVVLLGIILLVIAISFIVVVTSSKKKIDELSDSSNSLRVYIVDAKNDRVRYFNRSRLHRKKTSSITAFYNQFPARERNRVITWIGDLLDNVENTPRYLEVNVLFNYNKKSYFSILQVTKVDYTKSVIYLESYILKYMYAKKSKDTNYQIPF